LSLYVINTIHHTEGLDEWTIQTALQLSRKGGVEAEVVRPKTGLSGIRIREVRGITVHELPSLMVGPRNGFNRRLVEFTPSLPRYLLKRADAQRRLGYRPVLFLHEYRSYNSYNILRRVSGNVPTIAQHHGTYPTFLKFLFRLKRPRKLIHRVSPVYYFLKAQLENERERRIFSKVRLFRVLNGLEQFYLSKILKLKGIVAIGTMGVDLDEIDAVEKDKMRLREELGLPRDKDVLIYLGNIPDLSKGSDLIPRIIHELNKKRKVLMVMAGFIKDRRFAGYARSRGILVFDRLPHRAALKYLAAADAYILPARSVYYFGGIGVAALEAMALNVPVVSPTLIHLPEISNIESVGLHVPWCDDDEGLKNFIEVTNSVLDGGCRFNGREVIEKYFSWGIIARSLVRDLGDLSGQG